MAGEIDLDLVRTFLTAYRVQSLSAAARELGRAQSTVTTQIATLEAELGHELFERRPTGVLPNARAHALAARIARPLDELERVLWADRPGADDRLIHLAGPAEYLSHRVLPRLDAIVRTGTRVGVTFGLSDHLLAELGTGVHDLVISAVRPRLAGVTATALVDEEFALVAAPRWSRLTDGEPADPARWAGVPVIAYAEHLPIIRRFWLTVFDRRPAEIVPWATVPDLRTIAAMVRAGLGVSVLPTYLIDDDLAAGRLVRLAGPEVPPINTLYLAVRSGALDRDPALREVHTALVRVCRS
ncbi:LysR family transcriptional regulator [Nakamurella sp.]|uniref:LysR family transcriptional regulator n=1 Tax=Nakamurella sp. TaxID=1869182 RepID=UPI003782E80B